MNLLRPVNILPWLLIAAAGSTTLQEDDAHLFIQSLLGTGPSPATWMDVADLRHSERFGIHYDDTDDKFLIAFDLNDTALGRNDQAVPDYELQLEQLANEYTILHVTSPVLKLDRIFYFHRGRMISSLRFHTMDWQQVTTEYFSFFISDPAGFNDHCIQKLEQYILDTAEILSLTDRQLQQLREQKIDYYLCRDEDELERLTGHRARGLLNLAYDAVVSTFPNHYHELTHFLVNYALKELPLYTHPLLQEGLATALGGRGGKETSVILDLGSYIGLSGLISVQDLLSPRSFYTHNASLTYPLSGLYNRFLLDRIPLEDYLELYLKFSGPAEKVQKTPIAVSDLPGKDQWQAYLRSWSNPRAPVLGWQEGDGDLILEDSGIELRRSGDLYQFGLRDTLLLFGPSIISGYRSSTFHEWLPASKYAGEKYLLIADPAEIRVYDLWTNTLITNYVSSFTTLGTTVPRKDELFRFCLKVDVFDDPIESHSLEVPMKIRESQQNHRKSDE